MSFFQNRSRRLFSGPVPAQVLHIRMKQTCAEPFPVMTIIKLQRLCAEHGYFDMLLELLAEYNRDTGAQEKIARTVRSFLAQKII